MTKRWKQVARRIARAVGYTSKASRAEQLARPEEHAREQAHATEENERAGRRYLRP